MSAAIVVLAAGQGKRMHSKLPKEIQKAREFGDLRENSEFRAALDGDLQPKWTEVWSHLNLGMIFDITGQRERAVNEYNLAIRTKDNTQGAQEEAAKYLREPFKRKKPVN